MSLSAGTRLGPYEVIASVGAGGMGEVYRARDTRLKRDVALKILPTSFAEDPERVARFQREAEVLASLNHPNIAIIHGVEDAEGVRALVMELVDGETLADRIARGPLRLDEALPIAAQIVDALEAAHEHGIIHRDLKPANIKVRGDGTVKVLDFGLAKAVDPAAAAAGMTLSPTITSPALMTGGSIILGTAAYMSPEQARGRAADKRSDIWAFGCVLYEMVTGRRAFFGEDVTDTLAAVLRTQPDWDALPEGLPRNVRTVLEQSLQKDRQTRIADVAVIRFLLQHEADAPLQSMQARRSISWLALSAGAVAVGALSVGATWLAMRAAPPVSAPPMRFPIVPPTGTTLTLNGADRVLALSPDASRIVYAVGQGQLMVRATDRLESEPLPGITQARAPFISPDGKWVGFFEGAQVAKVAIAGGPSISLCGISGTPRGGSWGPDGRIVFATNNPATGLQSVSVTGGPADVLTRPAPGELDHLFPSVLPNGRGVLYTIVTAAEVQVAVFDFKTRAQKVLIRGGSHAEYVDSGHLVYASGGRLQAVPFDPDRLEIRGDAVPVSEPVTVLPNGAAEFSTSRTGALVYVPATDRTASDASRTLLWVDRSGREEPLSTPPRLYSVPRLSPDDAELAVHAGDRDLDLWLWNFANGTLRRLTVSPGPDAMPTWLPDRQRLVFSSARSGATNLFWVRVSTPAVAERLTTSSNTQYPMTVSPDGKLLVVLEQTRDTGNDLMLFRVPEPSTGNGATGKTEPLIATIFNESNPSISPDGRWLAYQSNEGGEMQVYVRPFPNVNDGIWPVSTSGGHFPLWSRTGRELFYAEADGSIMAVPVQTAPTFSAGKARKLFQWPTLDLPSPARNYDVSRDGQRFLMIKEPGASTSNARGSTSSIVMVLNWADALPHASP